MAEVSINILLLLPIILPFITSILAFGLRKWIKGFVSELIVGSLIINIAILCSIVFRVTQSSTKILYGFYNTTYGKEFGAPIGIQLRVDGLSSWFLLLLNIIIVFIFIFEMTKRRNKMESLVYNSIQLFLVAGINGSILANDFFTLFLSWVIIGVALIILIAFRQQINDLKENAIRTYILVGLSIILMLLAVVLSYGIFGSLNFDYIKNNEALLYSSRIQNAIYIIYFIIALIIVSFGLFANIFLLNLLQPKILEKASSEIQIFILGITNSLAIFSMFKILFSLFDPKFFIFLNYPIILMIIGLLTSFEGALLITYQILKKENIAISLNKILIFISIVNLGFILFGFSSAGLIKNDNVDQLLTLKDCVGYSFLQIINLALSMFLAVIAKDKILSNKNEVDDLHLLKGIIHEQPISTFILIVAFSSSIGILPTFGGVNIYMILFSLIQSMYFSYAVPIIILLILMFISYLFIIKALIFDKPITPTIVEGGILRDFSFSTFIGIIIALILILLGIVPSIISSIIIENVNFLIP